MAQPLSLNKSPFGLGRAIVFLLGCGMAAALTTSCLTPDFDFGDDVDGRLDGIGNGGSGSVAPHCTNRTKDADEADVDCGGLDCDGCALGRSCSAGRDCENGECTAGKCQAASCTDGLKNATETDADCGGDCPPCADDLRCTSNSDCESSSCKGGTCAAPTCSDRIRNGNESDIDCGGDECEPCESGQACIVVGDCAQPPAESSSSTICADDICTLLCPSGQGDCNSRVADGCEVNLNTDLGNCGSCASACNPDNTTAAKCTGGQCEIDFENGGCTGAWLDCNGMHDDGCETNSNTDPDNCGECNTVCSGNNGTATCSSGNCGVDCNTGFADCDSDPGSNGCEADTTTSVLHCGGCGNLCSATGGLSAACDLDEDPACISIDCSAPDNCGGTQPCGACDPDKTCNDPLNDTDNCGGCGIKCTAENATTACSDAGGGDYQCAVATCTDGGGADWEDCDGEYANGCESNVNVDINNCGDCTGSGGTDCEALQNDGALHIASITCGNGECEITACTGDFADCDGKPENGCEVDTSSSDLRCGGCRAQDANPGTGANCDSEWTNADGVCVNSACEFNECDTGFGDCENGLADGCEADLRTDEDHCGSCDAACVTDSYTSSNTCTSGSCNASCNSNGAKCDSNEWNGCENIQNDEENCGSCGNQCGGNGSDVNSASCSAKSCVVSCLNNLCPDSSDEAACTLPLGTVDNCTQCGESCAAPTPFCNPDAAPGDGCKSYKTISLISRQSATVDYSKQSTDRATTATINLNAAEVGHRVLYAFVAGTTASDGGVPNSVRYGSTDMTLLVASQTSPKNYTAIYYLGECALDNAGNNQTVSVTWPSWTYGGGSVEALLFENVEQGAASITTAKNLTNTKEITLDSVNLEPDSWYLAGTANQTHTVSSITPTGSENTASSAGPHRSTISVWGPWTGGIEAEFVSTWEEHAAAGVGIEPASSPNDCN